MVIVYTDQNFIHSDGSIQRGYFIDDILFANLEKYFVGAVRKKFDGVILVTGMEGAGKTTFASAIARFCDPTFPGEPVTTTGWRSTDRIVFTIDQIMEAIDDAKPGQAILIDEAALSMISQDAGTEIQRVLIKKFITIRKKQLFIFIVIPSIFLLRKYFAIFRTRALIHTYCPDGLSRGYYKFYSYATKRKLYIYGVKEFNQQATAADFSGKFINTENYFYDPKEYEKKKDRAIYQLTNAGQKDDVPKTVKYQLMELSFALMLRRVYDNEKVQPDNKMFAKLMLSNYGIELKGSMISKLLEAGKRAQDYIALTGKPLASYIKELNEPAVDKKIAQLTMVKGI